MNEHEKINYVEFPANDIQSTKDFFAQAAADFTLQSQAVMNLQFGQT